MSSKKSRKIFQFKNKLVIISQLCTLSFWKAKKRLIVSMVTNNFAYLTMTKSQSITRFMCTDSFFSISKTKGLANSSKKRSSQTRMKRRTQWLYMMVRWMSLVKSLDTAKSFTSAKSYTKAHSLRTWGTASVRILLYL